LHAGSDCEKRREDANDQQNEAHHPLSLTVFFFFTQSQQQHCIMEWNEILRSNCQIWDENKGGRLSSE
jgi:hypothetical protein